MFILNVKWLRNDNNHEVENVTKMFHADMIKWQERRTYFIKMHIKACFICNTGTKIFVHHI